nr:hypothetical protein [Tanacetum cinerariifolium]
MHKTFPLLVRKFLLPEGTSHCLKMNATVRRIERPLPKVCTAIEEKKKKLSSGRTVTITTEDMQRKKNDVKARTTLLLSLPDEHQLRFRKYKTAKELWAAILKTFGGYNAVPPPATDLYLSPKKDLSWTGLLKFVDDTVTDYSRPSPTVASTSTEGQIK